MRGKRLATVELGAGTAVPTVRQECERSRGKLIRINLQDTDGPDGSIVVPVGALRAAQEIDKLIGG